MSVSEGSSAQPRVPLRDQVREALQERIAQGTLRPGDRVFEQDIADEYGISRVPVREAIRMLQSDGLVEVRDRRRGVFVRSLDRRELEELFDVREALEMLAARLAAQRGSPEAIGRMGEFAVTARRALAAGDTEGMSRANSAFHEQLVALSGNGLLGSMLEPLHGRLAWMFRLNLEPERVCDEHDALHAAIVDGDAGRAADLARDHVGSSRRMVLDRVLY